MTSLKTSIKTITYLSDIGCLEIQGASLQIINSNSLITVIHSINTGKVILLFSQKHLHKRTKAMADPEQSPHNRHYLTKYVTVSVYITDLYSGVTGLHY